MASVFIGTKLFKNVERLPIGRLEELSEQAQAQLDNYDKYTKRVKSDKAKAMRVIHLQDLAKRRDIVKTVLEKRRAKELS